MKGNERSVSGYHSPGKGGQTTPHPFVSGGTGRRGSSGGSADGRNQLINRGRKYAGESSRTEKRVKGGNGLKTAVRIRLPSNNTNPSSNSFALLVLRILFSPPLNKTIGSRILSLHPLSFRST